MGKSNKEEILNEENTQETTTTNESDQAVKEDTITEREPKEENEVAKLEAELQEEKDKYLRLLAEYDNFRKRSAKEKLESFGDATAKVVLDILPVYDNFERALQAESTDENFKKGVEMIFNNFTDVLKKIGVEAIDPLGQEFDPNFAQAVNQVEDENYGENTVCQVFQKGYKLGDKIIRYAMVVVANP